MWLHVRVAQRIYFCLFLKSDNLELARSRSENAWLRTIYKRLSSANRKFVFHARPVHFGHSEPGGIDSVALCSVERALHSRRFLSVFKTVSLLIWKLDVGWLGSMRKAYYLDCDVPKVVRTESHRGLFGRIKWLSFVQLWCNTQW